MEFACSTHGSLSGPYHGPLSQWYKERSPCMVMSKKTRTKAARTIACMLACQQLCSAFPGIDSLGERNGQNPQARDTTHWSSHGSQAAFQGLKPPTTQCRKCTRVSPAPCLGHSISSNSQTSKEATLKGIEHVLLNQTAVSSLEVLWC